MKGRFITLEGGEGAGKSTVFSLLLRFYDAHAGRVLLDGVDLRQLDPAQLRDHIALVPQQATLFAASAADMAA